MNILRRFFRRFRRERTPLDWASTEEICIELIKRSDGCVIIYSDLKEPDSYHLRWGGIGEGSRMSNLIGLAAVARRQLLNSHAPRSHS